MAATWVAGTTTSRLTGTTLSASLPTSVATGDLVLAFVFARSALTPPAGWTLVQSVACVASGLTQTIYCYKKDTATSADAGVLYSWVQATSNRMGVTYAVMRGSGGRSVRIYSTAVATVSNQTTNSISVNPITAVRSQELQLVAATIVSAEILSYAATVPGMTLWSGSPTECRLAAFYQSVVTGESAYGSAKLASSLVSNGLAEITVSVSETLEEFEQIDQLSGADALFPGGSHYGTSLTDNLGASSLALWGLSYGTVYTDALTMSDTAAQSIPFWLSLLDSLVVSDWNNVSYGGLVSDMLGLSDTSDRRLTKPYTASDTVAAADVLSARANLSSVLADVLRVADLVTRGVPVTANESIGLSHTLSVARALSVIESLGLHDLVATTAHFGLTQVERFAVADALRRFFGEGFVDGIAVSSTLAPTKRAISTLTDALGVQHVSAPSVIFKVVEIDSVHLADLEFIRQMLKSSIVDGVEITAAYIGPNDVFTTWNINAVTGSVSRYDNFEFNSFAKFGQVHIGADSNGLYELNGVDDDGDAIIARVRSGLAQLTGSRFSIVRDAYIGMRSNGSFVLRVITGDNETYNYEFDAANMKTVRVPLGKGMRTRYVSFELIGKGDDFDLDAVEFIPLSSTRRV